MSMNKFNSKNHLSRRQFIELACLASLNLVDNTDVLAMARKQNQAVQKRPNILVLFSDQQHWEAAGFMNPFFETPNLDSFASQSLVFENAFCTTPQCSPSRSSMMTGLYPSKTNVMGNIGAAGGNHLEKTTIGYYLSKAGYYTGYFGKWHLGDKITASRGWEQKNSHNSLPGSDSSTEAMALSFLSSAVTKNKPFAMFASFENPHDIYYNFASHKLKLTSNPIELPESWYMEKFTNKPKAQKEFMTKDQGQIIWGEPKQEWQRYRDCYRENVKRYDANLGNIFDKLKREGLWDDTIIIVTSDHGDMDTNHRMIFKGPCMYEHLIRIPLLIRVPEKFGGFETLQTNKALTVNVDLTPTIADFCNIEIPKTDGISLKPLLTDKRDLQVRNYVIGQYYGKQKWVSPIRMIRTKNFKYNKYLTGEEELYDLINDTEELNNLAMEPKYFNRKTELSTMLDKWIDENNDPFYSL